MTTRRKVADEDSCLSGHRPDISGSSMNNDKTMTKNPFSSDFELDAFTKTQQYLIITSVLFFFTLLYGYLQELVAIHLFARQYGVFLTLVQFTGYTAFAALRRYGPLSVAAGSTSASSLVSLANAPASLGSSNSSGNSSNLGGALLASPASSSSLLQMSLSSSSTSSTSQPIMGQHHRRHTVPLSYCVGLAVGQAAMQSLSNLAMRYLNYPAKVMFKSCRVIPTMLFGVLVFKKKYSKQEWLAMVLLVLGLVAFTQADIHSGPDMDPFGIVLIVASLVLDAGILNVQDHCFTVFGSDEDEVVFTSYAGGTLLLLALCLLSGELTDALTFMNDTLGGATGVAAVSLVCFSTCGYLGVM